MKSVYLGSKLLFKKILLKTMEHWLLRISYFMRQYFCHLDPDTRKITSFEKIKLKIINSVPLSLTKLA